MKVFLRYDCSYGQAGKMVELDKKTAEKVILSGYGLKKNINSKIDNSKKKNDHKEPKEKAKEEIKISDNKKDKKLND